MSIVLTTNAKSKAYRYFSQRQLKQKVKNWRGSKFYNPRSGLYLLRIDTPQNPHTHRIVIHLGYENGDIVVVSQSGDHFDWSEMEHISKKSTFKKRLRGEILA